MTTIEEQILIEQRMQIEQRIQNDGKSMLLAYLFLVFLGGLGMHRFYLGKTKSALIMLFTNIAGFCLLIGSLIYFIALNVTNSINNFYFDKLSPAEQDKLFPSLLLTPGFIVPLLLGIVLLFTVLIWLFVDLFLVYGYVKKQNEALRHQLSATFQ